MKLEFYNRIWADRNLGHYTLLKQIFCNQTSRFPKQRFYNQILLKIADNKRDFGNKKFAKTKDFKGFIIIGFDKKIYSVFSD